MKKNSPWHWIVLFALIAWSLAVILPIDQKLTLGLDLQGGTSFILQVDTSELSEDAKRDAPQRALEVIQNRIDELGGREPIIYLEPKGDRIVVQIPGLDTGRIETAKKTLQRSAFLEFKLVHENSGEMVNGWLADGGAPPGYRAVDVGPNRFLKRDTTAVPEGKNEKELERLVRTFKAPPTAELMMRPFDEQGQELFEPVYVQKRRELSGEYLENAGVQQDYSRLVASYVVTIDFDEKGTKRFREVTSDYAPNGDRNPSPQGRRLAILLDGRLFSAPVLQTPIYNGNAQIEGTFTFQEAQELALVLRAGSLPADVEIIEQRTVDPSLGADSIASGKRAIIIGGLSVIAFIGVYYLLAGVIANLALVLDMVLLPLGMMVAAGFLGLFTGTAQWTGPISLPTLTLAGIAGIVLTIGMAVDANVLIFERIREEQKAGKRFRSAVEAGYEKVFSTIFDANLTTLLTAVILYWQGSGPIRGFAITLAAGIIVSMYVALVVTRMFFNILAKKDRKPIKMLSLLSDTNINFLSLRYVAAVLSVAVIAGSWFVFYQKGSENFGVDFTGGTSVTFSFDVNQKPPVDAVRDTLGGVGIDQALIQFQQNIAPNDQGTFEEFLEIKVPFGTGEAASAALVTEFVGAGFEVTKTDSVGPQVGRELRKKGAMSIFWALLGIIIYISIRFEFGFAVGAIVALMHDVLVTVGIYCLCGRELSLPIVAALLTIVGYSVNDTIVVFDRIREGIKLHKGMPYYDVANLSVNQTLSRTLMTSVTTLLTVIVLLWFGGGAIHDFALALFIGILVGTYSSVFVATPVTLLWHQVKKDGGDSAPAKKGKKQAA